MTEQVATKDQVCEHDFVCIECGSSLDDLQRPIGWMTEGGEMFIEHRLKLDRPEDFVRFTIPVPRAPAAANEEPADPVPSKLNDVPRLLDWTGVGGSPFNVARVDMRTQLIQVEECELNIEGARALREWLDKVIP